MNAADNDGWTALWACINGHADFSKFLCESGANANAAGNDGSTALLVHVVEVT